MKKLLYCLRYCLQMVKKVNKINGFQSPAKGVGCVKSAAEVQILSSAPRKARENIAFSLAFSFVLHCPAEMRLDFFALKL